jgi:hypothetical protein
VVNLEGGKIVTVQKAKKDGQKSTKVRRTIRREGEGYFPPFPVDPGDERN